MQARMGSIRLPGKMMMKIKDKPMVFYPGEQLRHSKMIDKIVIASSVEPVNDEMCDYLKSIGVDVVRGPENDVLKRFVQTAEQHDCDFIVRITGDEPLIDPFLTDKVIQSHLESGADYTSTKNYIGGECLRTVPKGLDSEVFSKESLLKIEQLSKTEYEREHVTPYFYFNPDEFRVNVYKYEPSTKGNPILTVDNKEDFDFVKEIIEELYDKDRPITIDMILNFVKNKNKPGGNK